MAMEFNKLVFAGLSIGCLAAAAGGSYLAVRQNQAAQSFESPAPVAPVAPAPPAAPAPVSESEGVITPDVVRPPVPDTPPAPTRRVPSASTPVTRSSRAEARPVERPSSRPSTRD